MVKRRHAADLRLRNQSCRAASIRDCQPSPVARKRASTSGDKRIVMRSLVGAFCGPRTPTLGRTDAGSASRAVRNLFKSAEEISRTSPFESISDLRFGISAYLASIGFAKADDANAAFSFHKAQDMKSVAEHSQGNVARFTVLSSVIDGIQSVFEIEIRSRVEWQTANAGIPFVFSGIERDTHTVNCTYNKMASSPSVRPKSCACAYRGT